MNLHPSVWLWESPQDDVLTIERTTTAVTGLYASGNAPALRWHFALCLLFHIFCCPRVSFAVFGGQKSYENNIFLLFSWHIEERRSLWERNLQQPSPNVNVADFQLVATHVDATEGALQQWEWIGNKWKFKWIGLVASGPEQCSLRQRSRKEMWVWCCVASATS